MVFVDTQNVVSDLAEFLGRPSTPTVESVQRALGHFGLVVEPADVTMSVALADRDDFERARVVAAAKTRPARERRDAQRFLAYAGANAATAKKVRQAGGQVIKGRLRRGAGGRIEEKQVDVLLALAIAKAAHEAGIDRDRIIVLMSGDTDLEPAVRFALTAGLRTFVAAADPRVRYWCFRNSGCGVLHLCGSALAALGRVPLDRSGHRLRQAVARAVNEPGEQDWTVVSKMRNDWLCRQGALFAIAPGAVAADIGAVVRLASHGVDYGADRKGFPLVRLRGGIAGRPHTLQAGQVTHHWSAGKVTVLVDGISKRVEATPGYLVNGTRVLVDTSGTGWRLVGALANKEFTTQLGLRFGRGHTEKALVATVTRKLSGKRAMGRLDGGDENVTVCEIPGGPPRPGDRYACLLESTDRAVAISTRLPLMT